MISEPVQFLFNENMIIYLQSLGNPIIDFLFLAITFTGSQPVYFFLASLIFWCFNKKTGIRIMYVILFSAFASIFAKNLFALPRPPEYLHKINAMGFGFPSGHAQVSSSFWGYAGCRNKNLQLIFFGIIAVLSVSLSRIYLGVHYLADVIGGILFGLSVAFIFLRTDTCIASTLQRLDRKSKYSVAVVLPVALTAITSIWAGILNDAIEGGLVMAAIGIGYLLEGELVSLQDAKNNRQRVKRAFTGVLILLLIYSVSRLVFPNLIFFEYTALGLTSTFIAPWVITRMEGQILP